MSVHPEYWQRACSIGNDVYIHRKIQNVDEQAGPAYFATSGLSRWLFWQRLKWAAAQIDNWTGEVAVDFGSGFGLLLPHLRQRFPSTVAVDLMPTLAAEFMQRWDSLPTDQDSQTQSSGQLRIVSSLAEAELPSGSVDLILALDVLEHFESLDSIVEQLAGLLKPNGQLLVSGPTESWLYKFGRRLVGFSGDYHHQTIYDVHTALARKLRPVTIQSLPPLMPLFLMSRWRT